MATNGLKEAARNAFNAAKQVKQMTSGHGISHETLNHALRDADRELKCGGHQKVIPTLESPLQEILASLHTRNLRKLMQSVLDILRKAIPGVVRVFFTEESGGRRRGMEPRKHPRYRMGKGRQTASTARCSFAGAR